MTAVDSDIFPRFDKLQSMDSLDLVICIPIVVSVGGAAMIDKT